MAWDIALSAFVTFFVIIDPLGIAPIFASLTFQMDDSKRRRTALRSVLVTGAILLFFAFIGGSVIEAAGISLAAFSVAGGALLFLIGLEMVFSTKPHKLHQSESNDAQGTTQQESDPAIVPLAIPLMAGPGAIASVLLLMTNHAHSPSAQAAVLGAMGVVLCLALIIYIFAGTLLRLAGETVAQVISRIMGVLLCALAVQYIFNGLQDGLFT